jgi:phosphoribosylformylglycinamidine cyclo-ligase
MSDIKNSPLSVRPEETREGSSRRVSVRPEVLQGRPNDAYRDAGVNIAEGNAFVKRIQPIAAKTRRPEVLAGLGGFGALFELPLNRYRNPVLVSSTDGVGTKLKLALALNKHDTIGIDLVAMCVNDIIVQGAEPLFFLDYFATGRLQIDLATEIIQGIGVGCAEAGVALIGGETAEMPGVYQDTDYDLAGFAVGIVEKSQIIDGSKVRPGDAIIGLASSGLHSNGFSLVRKILQVQELHLETPIDGGLTLGDILLKPTRIYVKPLLQLMQTVEVHAMAHITGGGLLENIPRVLPPHTQARLQAKNWPREPIFSWLQTKGDISDEEMHRTFNCGIGMVICLPPSAVPTALELLHQAGEKAYPIGMVETAADKEPQVIINA